MVKLIDNPYWQTAQTIEPEAWLESLPEMYRDNPLLKQACALAYQAGHDKLGANDISIWQHGLSISDSLAKLNTDPELLAAALLYPFVVEGILKLKGIQEHTAPDVANLIMGAMQMDAVSDLHSAANKSHAQIENCRKMLLAMAEDLRIVLLKLAERLHALRTARFLPEEKQKKLGLEITALYAPLANRLGLGQLKWELEDLAFRITSPIEYKKIAQELSMKRSERESLIQKTLAFLEQKLKSVGVTQFELMGRAKHIYSIHRKMTKKGVSVRDLFDISAVRVLVETVEDCYRVLDLVQQEFSMIPEEFDDYVSAPKPNGYRSIHTAVIGPEQHVLEIQIRTFAMHQESELGFAAHWRYKEGGASNQAYEAKIAWLREILSWQNEVEAVDKAAPNHNVLSDRVYVLTPQGDVIDLPEGSTPLDFAYAIHTNIGHRCRGAKVNGHIVPLTTKLRMGDRVEVLTNKFPNPSRDWTNPQRGFLFTARARAKVAHWLRQQDHELHIADGKLILDKELRRLNLHDVEYDALIRRFDYEDKDSFFAALGSGELRQTQLAGRLEQWYKEPPKPNLSRRNMAAHDKPKNKETIFVEGADKLLTHVARCCEPKPGEAIAAYISSRRGVSIHKLSCKSFQARKANKPDHVLTAAWGVE